MEGAPPDRDLYELARALRTKQRDPIPPLVSVDRAVYQAGRQEAFWLVDLLDTRAFQRQATLLYASPHAYWWATEDSGVTKSEMEEAARVFEKSIYPSVTAAFGTPWPEGQETDSRITILHARLRGVAGYYSSSDEYPPEVHPQSNGRTIIYINAGALRPGSTAYLATLSHELQHAIHWRADESEETWVNEGLSEVASDLAGYPPGSASSFTAAPNRSLMNWPLNSSGVIPYYGANFMFFTYLAQRYGGYDNLALLLKEPSDGIEGVDAYLAQLGYKVTFRDVFQDWVVANYMDRQGPGPYEYADSKVRVALTQELPPNVQVRRYVPQYAADYLGIDLTAGSQTRIRFQGETRTPLLSDPPTSGDRCWWSNRGDSIDTTLTRELDLSGLTSATLRYKLWYDIEEQWDYAYVEVSTDGGVTWDILATPGSTPENPVGNSFGPGYSGQSGGWLSETVELSPYSGRSVLLRFQYVTDDALHGAGLCLDDISAPELSFSDDAEAGNRGWVAAGFRRAEAQTPQDFIVQVITFGKEAQVLKMTLDAAGSGEVAVSGDGAERAVVVVAALSPDTRISAGYTLAAEPLK